MHVVGVFRLNVSTEGIGALSRAVREVCIAVHSALDLVMYGACCRRAKIGVKASCSTYTAWSRVRLRFLFVHSICRCGEFPFTYGRCLR